MHEMSRQLFIAKKILLTLGYCEQFQFPLTAFELYIRLLSNVQIQKSEFISVLKYLFEKKKIEYSGGFFLITGLHREKSSLLIETRKERAKFSEKKWLDVEKFISFAKNIPFITGVAVTGSVAVENAIADDDIDFMIVTKPNRVWLARLLVIAYASLRGKRRSFAREEKNSWCFNLWVEESDLQLPSQSRSVYEAYEVLQAQWVLSRGNVAERFWRLNNWTSNYIVGTKLWHKVNKHKNADLSIFDFYEVPIVSEVVFILFFITNYCAYLLQYLYMKPHMTREKVSRTHAFFHPRDTRSAIFFNWKKTVRRLV